MLFAYIPTTLSWLNLEGSMVGVSLTLLVLAALGGTTMAVLRLRGAPYPPLVLAIGHGLLAAAGLACLAYAGNDQLGRYANGRPGRSLACHEAHLIAS